jgi:hypothetical protein
MRSISGLKLAKEQARDNFRFLGDWAPEETAITKLQSRSEADFCRRGPLTGRVFAHSIHTHVKHYIKMICVVLENKSKARHVREHGLSIPE